MALMNEHGGQDKLRKILKMVSLPLSHPPLYAVYMIWNEIPLDDFEISKHSVDNFIYRQLHWWHLIYLHIHSLIIHLTLLAHNSPHLDF